MAFEKSFLVQKSVWAESEFLDHLEVAIALHACRGEHVVRDSRVRAALERLFAVVAKNASSASQAQERMRVDESVNRHDAAEFVVRKLREVLERSPWNRVEYIDRR